MRYLPHTDADIKQMLATIGVADTDALFSGIPADCRLTGPLDLPQGLAEADMLKMVAIYLALYARQAGAA